MCGRVRLGGREGGREGYKYTRTYTVSVHLLVVGYLDFLYIR